MKEYLNCGIIEKVKGKNKPKFWKTIYMNCNVMNAFLLHLQFQILILSLIQMVYFVLVAEFNKVTMILVQHFL